MVGVSVHPTVGMSVRPTVGVSVWPTVGVSVCPTYVVQCFHEVHHVARVSSKGTSKRSLPKLFRQRLKTKIKCSG